MNPVEVLEKAKATATPETREEIELVLEAGTLEEQEALAARLSVPPEPAPVAPVERKPSRKTLCELKRRANRVPDAPPEARAALAARARLCAAYVPDNAGPLTKALESAPPLYCGECVSLRYGARGAVCGRTKREIAASQRACTEIRIRQRRTT